MNQFSRRCKACGCPLRFVKTKDGKVIPLDVRSPVYEVQKDLTGQEIATPAVEAYVSHFSTCPKSDEFSKTKR